MVLTKLYMCILHKQMLNQKWISKQSSTRKIETDKTCTSPESLGGAKVPRYRCVHTLTEINYLRH